MSTLYIIATPIGNLADMTPRAIDTLRNLHILFCEDTRHTGNLLKLLDIPKPQVMLSNHDHNERGNVAKIISYLNDGNDVGICTDAGFPVISDPGYPAVMAAIEAGHAITVIPGANAALLAVISSGLPCSSFIYKGFAPRKPGNRRRFLEMDANSPHTMVFYESPFRIEKLLMEAKEAFGNRQAAVCLELTKKFERVSRGPLSQLISEFADKKIKGEAVVVISGCGHDELPEEDSDDDGTIAESE
ncbi:MAG: 16S rRNA (cytidine(1402)-2'-O)-methyltransferase [Victivallales bacterium]|nr:16S rRNA (cytidine(1402)-2'-O)-methyltransferase [Victivallales bacterium]